MAYTANLYSVVLKVYLKIEYFKSPFYIQNINRTSSLLSRSEVNNYRKNINVIAYLQFALLSCNLISKLYNIVHHYPLNWIDCKIFFFL